jgi:signal transduction histidine kinase
LLAFTTDALAATHSKVGSEVNKSLSHRADFNAWFIQLRWIACAVAVILVVTTIGVFQYLEPSLFVPLIILIGVLAATNVAYTILARKPRSSPWIAESQIVTDLFILTAMLHFSGGIENPLSLAYLFHVILSGILLSRRKAYIIAFFSFGLFASLAVAELTGVIGHYTLDIFPHTPQHDERLAEDEADDHTAAVEDEYDSPEPVELEQSRGADDHGDEQEGRIHASHHPLFVASMCALCLFLMVLTAYFVTTIMERLRREERRTREERQRLERVLDATGAGLLILDKRLCPIWHNDPVSQWLEVDGKVERWNGVDSWTGGAEGAATQTLADGSIRSVERERILSSGEKQYFQVTVAPLTDTERGVYQVVELIQDITEKKVMEAEILHADKMVTLGTMAAGIAHEVGNPLASISTRLQLLESDRDEEFVSASLPLLRREIARIERIVRGISQFGRPSQDRWGLIDLNDIVRETVDMLQYNRLSKFSRIESQLNPALPRTLGVKDQLKQVFLNLGLNALEAMPDGGELVLRTFVAAGEVRVAVSDDGTGLDPGRKDKIFQPFFTSKEKGAGLGLFIVNHLVQAHGGSIVVEGKSGEGTTFTVGFPLHGVRSHSERLANSRGSE